MPAKPAPDAPALPKIDEIESVAPDKLPDATRRTLDETETALAQAIIAATENGNVAVGPKVGTDRKIATAAAARIRRLILSYYAVQGVALDERPTVSARVVSKDGGYAWGIAIRAAEPDTAEEAAPEGGTVDPAEGDTADAPASE